jgi:hypothetical protein
MRANGETKILEVFFRGVGVVRTRASAAVERRGIPSRTRHRARFPLDVSDRSHLVVIGRFVVEWVHTHIIQGTYTTARGLHARAFRRHRRARERCAGANRRAYDRRRIERACPREGVART